MRFVGTYRGNFAWPTKLSTGTGFRDIGFRDTGSWDTDFRDPDSWDMDFRGIGSRDTGFGIAVNNLCSGVVSAVVWDDLFEIDS